MSVGGATWDTAGALDLGSGNTFATADATQDSPPLDNQAWWTFTPSVSASIRLTQTDTALTAIRLYTGTSFATKVFVEETDFTDPTTTFPVVGGVAYHVLVGTDGGEVPTAYQVTYASTPFTVGPWISDYRDNTENFVIIHGNSGTLDFPVGATSLMGDAIQEQPHRSGEFSVAREIDSPDYPSNACAWGHAKWGDFDGIVWEGICPTLLFGTVDGVALHASPYFNSSYGPTHGGTAQEHIMGHGFWAHRVYEKLEPFGSLGTPDPTAHGYPVDAVLEIEQLKPDLVSIEYTGDDEVPRPALDSGATPVDVNWLNTHIIPPPSATVPTGFDAIGGTYTQWPKGGLSGIYTYIDGPPEWQLLIDGENWDYFNFPTEDGDPYVPADFLFGAAAVHESPDNGTGGRGGFTISIRLTLRAPRYRWIFEGALPVTRQNSRDDGRGLSAAPRLVPAPKSARLVGGHQ